MIGESIIGILRYRGHRSKEVSGKLVVDVNEQSDHTYQLIIQQNPLVMGVYND